MNFSDLSEREKKLISSSVLFKGLSYEEADAALCVFEAKKHSYAKGEMLHRPYGRMTRFGMVLSGVVQVCTDDIEGCRVIMAEVVPGVTFGESLCFLEIKDSPAYVYASEPAEVMWLSVRKLYGTGGNEFTAKLQKRFTAMLAQRTLAMNSRIQVLSKIKLRDKLMTYFNQLSQKSGSLTFTVPVNREDLAAYMGTNRSALSRELSQMKRDGLIDYYGHSFRLLK